MDMYSRCGDFRYLIKNDNAVIIGYEEISCECIKIPSEINGYKVTSVAEVAFFHCSVKHVVIPEGVEEICEGAFSECAYLKKVALPSTLKKVTIPEAMT